MTRLIAVMDPQREFARFSRIAHSIGFSCVEIDSWNQIAFRYVHCDFVQVELQGVPLQDFAAVLYTGIPSADEIVSAQDAHFVRTERERALVAAFVQTNTKAINAGWYLSDNWTTQTPEYQVFKLAELGWPIADISWHFVLGKGLDKGFSSSVFPKALVLVSQRSHYIISVEGDAHPEVPKLLLSATKDYVRSLHLDWILIGLSVEAPTRFTACGCGAILPLELPDSAVKDLFEEALKIPPCF